MVGGGTRVVYNTATTLNGVIAEPTAQGYSLDWLFAIEPAPEAFHFQDFLRPIRAIVMGSSTYEWVIEHEDMLDHPERWAQFHGHRPAFVFSHRKLPVPKGAPVRILSGPVREAFPIITSAVGGGPVWLVGGGELAGQFYDAGLLTELQFSIGPALLPAGAHLLPRKVPAERLSLRSAEQYGAFVHLTYDVLRPGASD